MQRRKPMRKYENLSTISENREKQRSYYIPQGGHTSLNGTWNFKYYNCDFEEAYLEKEWDEIEKSVILSIADDVIVGVKGTKADITIIKNFTKE